MANVKQEYVDRSKRILMRSEVQQKRFLYANYGENTPIDAKKLEDVPRGKIIIDIEVFKKLLTINDESEKARAEFSYFLTGTTEGQTVRFDDIVFAENQGNSRQANFTPLLKNLNAYVNSVQQMGIQNAIVCNGHTHPKQLSRYAEDFSLADMAGFMQMKEENAVFKSKKIELCSGIMSDLNFNFCFYDDRMQDFYKFNDVVVELETGEQIPLSCYDRKVSRAEILDKVMRDNPMRARDSFKEGLKKGAPTFSEQSQLSINAQRRQRLLKDLGIIQNDTNERVE